MRLSRDADNNDGAIPARGAQVRFLNGTGVQTAPEYERHRNTSGTGAQADGAAVSIATDGYDFRWGIVSESGWLQ